MKNVSLPDLLAKVQACEVRYTSALSTMNQVREEAQRVRENAESLRRVCESPLTSEAARRSGLGAIAAIPSTAERERALRDLSSAIDSARRAYEQDKIARAEYRAANDALTTARREWSEATHVPFIAE